MENASKSTVCRDLNIIITGDNIYEKCILGNILASSMNKFDPRIIRRSPAVHTIWSSYLKNTRLKIIVTPSCGSVRYQELLRSMASFRHRCILYVENGRSSQEGDTMQNIHHLMSHFGNYKTRYIPVIYREHKYLHEPMTHKEMSFLQKFPKTHYHAPLISKESDQKEAQKIILDYINYSIQRKDSSIFENYEAYTYLHHDPKSTCKTSASAKDHDEVHDEVTSPAILTSSKNHDAVNSPATCIPISSKEARTTFSDSPVINETVDTPQCEVSYDDLVLYNEALSYGFTRSHHIRVMVVGPNGSGKTTLINRLQLQPVCLVTSQAGKEGITIENMYIRCRKVEGTLEWEAEREGTDFKRKLDAQKVGFAMNEIESDYINRTDTISNTDDGNDDWTEPDYESIYSEDDNTTSSQWPRNGDDTVSFDEVGVANIYWHRSDDSVSVDERGNLPQNDNQSDTSDFDDSASLDTLFVGEALWHKKQPEETAWTYCSFWDFDSDATYHFTHQLFLSKSAIYLLVLDLSKDIDTNEIESLDFWLGSIMQNSNVSICLVASHGDKFAEKSVTKQKLEYLSKKLQINLKSFALDNTQTQDDDLLKLMEFIEMEGKRLGTETIPANWIKLEKSLKRTKQEGTLAVEFDKLMGHFASLGFAKDSVVSFLHYQNSRGQLFYFSQENATLRGQYTVGRDVSVPNIPIFLDPLLLIRVINQILKKRPLENFEITLRTKNVAYFEEGVLDDKYITDILAKMNNTDFIEYKDHVINALIALYIVFEFKVDDRQFFYMPCLLKQEPGNDIFTKYQSAPEKTSVLVIRFKNSHICHFVFLRLVAALHKYYTPYKRSMGNIDRMQFYSGYVSFNLSASGLQQMQIYCKNTGIHLRIFNFSGVSLNTFIDRQGNTLCPVTLATILDCLNEVLIMDRNYLDYDLMVICPEHFMPPSLVQLDVLEEENSCLCPSDKPHALTKERALQFWISSSSFGHRQDTTAMEHNTRLTSKDVGRVAMKIKVNIHLLAHVLQVTIGAKADFIQYENPNNTKLQTLMLLRKWKQEKGNKATCCLLQRRLKKIFKRREGDWICKLVRENRKNETYGLPADTLQAIPSEQDLWHFIGSCLYPKKLYFFFLELGLSFPDIEQAKEQKREFDMTSLTLLIKWKRKEEQNASFQTLLDTANHVGLDITPIIESLKKGYM